MYMKHIYARKTKFGSILARRINYDTAFCHFP